VAAPPSRPHIEGLVLALSSLAQFYDFGITDSSGTVGSIPKLNQLVSVGDKMVTLSNVSQLTSRVAPIDNERRAGYVASGVAGQ
jgi:hypothetical protein